MVWLSEGLCGIKHRYSHSVEQIPLKFPGMWPEDKCGVTYDSQDVRDLVKLNEEAEDVLELVEI